VPTSAPRLHFTSESASDVLLANQLYYETQASEYDRKHHVGSRAIQQYYEDLFNRFVFAGRDAREVRTWKVCDIGCGTGFLESFLQGRVGSIVSVDATLSMLKVARRKLPARSISWVLADAQALPIEGPQFDLVCANALLHHVYGFDQVIAKMASLVKPGGRIFLGYEPNAIPYRLFWPVLKVAARMLPEHRNRKKIQQAGGAGQARAGEPDLHQLAEYHIFRGQGIHPFRLRDRLRELGIVHSRLHFTSLYQAALLRDAGLPFPLDLAPLWMYRISGRLSLSFSLTGSKG
jgi:ubiquinone/menaquinone biosynthesis C-methylase UbiE